MICSNCKGEKRVRCTKCYKGWVVKGTYSMFTITQCVYCFGKEQIKCPKCKGIGEISKGKQK